VGGNGDAATSDSTSPGNSITGSVNGKPFNTVSNALYAGKPDDPASTVVFMFEAPVQCSEIGAVGWDTRVMNGSQVLELKLMGTAPMVYTVTTSTTPAPGEASVNHAIAMPGTPPETSSNGGTVTLAALNVMTSAIGSFDLTYPNGSLQGTFNATYCAGGVEP
jgi:hypothetical protein